MIKSAYDSLPRRSRPVTSRLGALAGVQACPVVVFLIVASSAAAAWSEGQSDLLDRRALREVVRQTTPLEVVVQDNDIRMDLGGLEMVFKKARIETDGTGERVIIAESVYTSWDGKTSPLTRPWEIPDGRVSLIGARLLFLEAFGGLRIFAEWSCVGKNRRPLPEPKADSIVIHKNETLRSALTRLAEASGGRLEWRELSGVIWIQPAQRGDCVIESALDTVISLQLHAVTPWRAMVELVRQVNASPDLARPFSVKPDFLFRGELPLPGVDDVASVSLGLSAVTAREALSAILSQSGHNVEGGYENHAPTGEVDSPLSYVASLYVSFLNDSGVPVRTYKPLDAETREVYLRDARQGEQDALTRISAASSP